MFPMIAAVREFDEARLVERELTYLRRTTTGFERVEIGHVGSSVIALSLDECWTGRFLSVGSNDLAQFLFAATAAIRASAPVDELSIPMLRALRDIAERGELMASR